MSLLFKPTAADCPIVDIHSISLWSFCYLFDVRVYGCIRARLVSEHIRCYCTHDQNDKNRSFIGYDRCRFFLALVCICIRWIPKRAQNLANTNRTIKRERQRPRTFWLTSFWLIVSLTNSFDKRTLQFNNKINLFFSFRFIEIAKYVFFHWITNLLHQIANKLIHNTYNWKCQTIFNENF